MLHEFISSNRRELIERCKAKAEKRFQPVVVPLSPDHGVPLFLTQLADILRGEQERSANSPAAAETAPSGSVIGRSAALRGAELLQLGYSIAQVVHEYGDVCQAVAELAIEHKMSIATEEFRTLNRCLDNAIADAVTAFGRIRQQSINNRADELSTRLETFHDEQGRLIETAIQSFAAIQTGSIGISGATAAILSDSLFELRTVTDRSISDIRLKSAMTTLDAA